MSASAQTTAQPVLQRGYDANVSGANLGEITLNTTNVSPATFGLLYKLPVDANVYAQPLYVPNVSIAGLGTHNVLYVATMNDSIYAFDADVGGAPLWSVNLASFLSTVPVVWSNFNFPPISTAGNLGILSTPVIDPSTHIMYVVACTLENGTMAYRLHGIDITDGTEPYGPGVLIAANRNGATFDARYLTQRASLALAMNQVIVGFGAMQSETNQPYTGWVLAYDELTLQQSGSFNTVTANTAGGVWQSGRPPAVDSTGYVYVFVGNAQGSAGYDGVSSFSESVLKLDPSQGLALVDWFTPADWPTMDAHDQDLTSSGPLLIPGTALVTGGGKTGKLYVLNTTNLGHYAANDTQIPQKESITSGEITGGPVYWNRSAGNGGPLMYDWGWYDVLKVYPFNGLFASSPSALGSTTVGQFGAAYALSANADQHGSGLLWATTPSPSPPTAGGILHVYDAENVSSELWNSTMNPNRDGFKSFSHYVPPLVANGKVYVSSSYPGTIYAYGLLPYTVSPSTLAFGAWQTNTSSVPQTLTVTNVGSAGLLIGGVTITGTNTKAFSQTNTCANLVPAGSTCTISVVFNPTSSASDAATLNIIGANGTGTQLVTLTGTAVAPSYSVTPATLAFGSETINTASAPQSATVTNSSSASLPITSVTISGTKPVFSQTNTCATSVPANSTCVISVIFTPASVGSKSATLYVNGGGGAGSQPVSLTGAGVTGSYTVSPTVLAFGSVAKKTLSAPQLVTVANAGSTAIPIAAITLSGPEKGQFEETSTCGNSLPGGSSCTISVVFAPTYVGSMTAELNVNAGGSTQQTALGGSGF